MASALDELFETEGELIALRGGEILHSLGEPAAALHRLTSGRLAVTRPASGGGSHLIGVRRPGDILGAGALIADLPHDSTATALRDCVLLCLPRARVEAAAVQAAIYADLARTALTHRIEPRAQALPRATILGFVAVCDSVVMRQMVEALAVALRAQGRRAAVLGAESLDCGPERLSALEDAHDVLLMTAERTEHEFTHYCGRQIDRLILVGRANSPLPEGPFRFAALAILRHRLVDVVLIQPPDCARPTGSARWLEAAPAARLFHIRDGARVDIDRLARTFSGRSVGLALSGGGARAYAHIGVLRALEEIGAPIDFLAGTSMGAVVAGGVAMGWPLDELEARIRDAFVRSSPLADIALPLVAMTHGRRVDSRLAEHFADTDITDLWRPFVCVSTDLTTGEMRPHRKGALHRALRASISLPGVLPPVVEDGHVLVDGSLTRNLPVDLIQDLHDGATIGVDVAEADGLTPEDLKLRPSGVEWLLSGAWRRGPPIVSVLIRSVTMPTARQMAATRDRADVVIVPELGEIELQDWKAYGPAVEAGYRAAMAQAEKLAACWRIGA